MFHEKLRLEEVCSLNYILDVVQPCIDIDSRSSETYVYIDYRRCKIHVHDTLGNWWRIIIEDPWWMNDDVVASVTIIVVVWPDERRTQ